MARFPYCNITEPFSCFVVLFSTNYMLFRPQTCSIPSLQEFYLPHIFIRFLVLYFEAKFIQFHWCETEQKFESEYYISLTKFFSSRYFFLLLLLNLFSFNSIIAWYIQGPRSSFQSAGADPPLLKRSWGGRGVRGGEVVGLWTLKMVYLAPTQYFLIQLQLINHYF